jgi:hypothetical protein
VDDLGHRLNNLRHRGFGLYLHREGREATQASRSTLYRLARYFGSLEQLYDQLGVVKLENHAGTRAVSLCLADVGKTFTTDSYGPQLMLWREEQRAIGERMATDDGRLMGYAEFFDRYEASFALWLDPIADDLRSVDLPRDRRLRELQRALAGLATTLDPTHADIQLDKPADSPTTRAWWVPEMYAPPAG